MVLDLKDAFFTIPLHHSSQSLFAFTWTDPDTYQSQQLTWTILPQGLEIALIFFGQALQRDLQTLDLGSTISLQYVDDLLLCTSSYHNSLVHTVTVLNALGSWGYRVLLSKAHIASTTVSSLGLLLTPTSKIIPAQRLRALTQTPPPQAPNQEGTSFSIRSIKLLLNMGPKICPPHKTSLPSYSRKSR